MPWRGVKVFRLLRAFFGNVDAQLSLAIDNWLVPAERQNRTRALYWARRAAQSGDSRAGELLATILFDSRLPDEVVARNLFDESRAGAAAGDAVAQYTLGWCHEQGVGVTKDLRQALHWYTTAAANGDTDAAACVARLCAGTPGTPGAIPARANTGSEIRSITIHRQGG
jgi:uncharacterized protein